MPNAPVEMTLSDYAHVVRRRKWIVIVSTLLAAVVAVGRTALQTPIYSTSSQVLIQPRGQDGFFDDVSSRVDFRSIDTEIQVIEGQAVRTQVQEDLDLSSEPPSANASAIGDANVISINVRDTNTAGSVDGVLVVAQASNGSRGDYAYGGYVGNAPSTPQLQTAVNAARTDA